MSQHEALQNVGAAIAAIVDTNAAVVALTGRSTGNIFRVDQRALVVPNSVIFEAQDATIRGGIGESYDVTVVLHAEADGTIGSTTPGFASQLLSAAIDALVNSSSVAAFAAHSVDAVVMQWSFHTPERNPETTNLANVPAEAQLSVWITL